MSRVTILLVVLFMCGVARFASGQAATQPATAPAAHLPEIVITTSLEEGKKVLVATVKLHGKPVEGAKVNFFVRRTFGNLPLGQEQTLDDGTAAVPFPENLPGDESGKLQVLATITEPAQYASASGQATVDGGVVVRPEPDPFPRALWAPHAPLMLIVTFGVLLGGVWCAYVYVFSQLFKIRKGVKP